MQFGLIGHWLLVMVLAIGCVSVHGWTDPAPDAGAVAQQDKVTGAPDAPVATPRSLSEVGAVSLTIRGSDEREWSRFGYSDAKLRAAISERLAQAGITVVEATAKAQPVPLLEVSLHVNNQAFQNSYIVFVRLKDYFPLPNSREGYVTQTVWSDWQIGGFEAHQYRKLQPAILKLVDNLLSSYHVGR